MNNGVVQKKKKKLGQFRELNNNKFFKKNEKQK